MKIKLEIIYVLYAAVVVIVSAGLFFIVDHRIEDQEICEAAGGVLINSGRANTVCLAAEAVIRK